MRARIGPKSTPLDAQDEPPHDLKRTYHFPVQQLVEGSSMNKMILIATLVMSSSIYAAAADLPTLEPASERATLPTYTISQLPKSGQTSTLPTLTPAHLTTEADEPRLPTIQQ